MEETTKAFPARGWGSQRQPIIVKVKTADRAEQVARICDHHGWNYIMGMEFVEDVTDLKKAIQEHLVPADSYGPCPCGSGEKYKFCCAKTLKGLASGEFLDKFDPAAEK